MMLHSEKQATFLITLKIFIISLIHFDEEHVAANLLHFRLIFLR